jgi:hypothetical protein
MFTESVIYLPFIVWKHLFLAFYKNIFTYLLFLVYNNFNFSPFWFSRGYYFRLLKEQGRDLRFHIFPTNFNVKYTMAHLARIANMNCSRSIISQWQKSPLLAQQVCSLLLRDLKTIVLGQLRND